MLFRTFVGINFQIRAMRELTDKEKTLTNTLVKRYQPNSDLVIGDILLDLYNITYIAKHTSSPSDSFYKDAIIVGYYYDPNINFDSDFYEALLLIDYLVRNEYLILKPMLYKEEIGVRNTMASIFDPKTGNYGIKSISIFDVFNFKTWPLLNSTFIVTNVLKDYAKDFKTIEQRRFEKQLKDTKKALKISQRGLAISIAALFISITSSFISIWISKQDTNVNPKQINDIEKAIRNSKTDLSQPIEITLKDTIKIINTVSPKEQVTQ